MAPLVMHLPRKSEDLSPDPQNLIKVRHGSQACMYNPSVHTAIWEVETGESLEDNGIASLATYQ